MFIVTINTWKCEGDYDRRISNLARHLSVLKPDILFVQEVFVAPEVEADTGRRLSYALPEHRYIPVAARTKLRKFGGRDVVSVSGLTIFTRGELLASSVIELPGLPEDPDRVAQLVKVRFGRMDIQLINLHLTHIRGANPMRRQQLEVILENTTAGPLILAGDFNSRPDSEPMLYLASEVDEVVVCSEPTGPGGNVIDYVAWRGLKHQGFQSEPLFTGQGTPRVSDHAGVGVYIDLGPAWEPDSSIT